MRFKKGCRVEVLGKGEVPSGAWYPAEILLGNDHYYNVKYDNASCVTRGDVAEKVHREAMRPCPPLIKGVESWTVGDVVEVFIVCSWKVATVRKTFTRNNYQVKLLGCSEEYRVHISNVRARQFWQDDKWIVMAKGSGSTENMKFSKVSMANRERGVPSLPFGARTKLKSSYDCLDTQKNSGFEESHFISSRTLKRASPYQSSYVDAYTRKRQRLRPTEEQGEHQRVISRYESPLLNKVDVVAYPKQGLGKTCMHSSFSNQTLGYYEMSSGKRNDLINCYFGRIAEGNDSSSNASSVGSCSVGSYSPNKLPSHNLAVDNREADMLSSDAESFSGRGDLDEKCTSLLPEENLWEDIHRLELHAYKCTLGALYASGPLSWEQEEMLTDLRLSLHISNDEHSRELKNLISGGMNMLGQHCGHASLASKVMHGFATFVLA